jgi:ABC-type branched-subunit amino acid transport system ATPase component/ABC-type branched-subunit amino acid transport system permease subunit
MSTGSLVLGLLNGMTIGLLAAGFVLVYKSNRFLNVAHAQLGAASALLLHKLVADQGWNWWLAAGLCLALGVLVGLGVERWLIRPVRRRTSSPIRLLMLTIGVSQILLVLTYMPALSPDNDTSTAYPQPFGSSLEIGGVRLSGMSVLTLVVVPALLLLLTGFLGYTSLGRQIRAAANNPDAARLCGVSIDRVSLLTWGVAGGLSAAAAILSGPSTAGFSLGSIGPNLLMYTMGAAAVGAFVSIPAAVGGGVFLGIAYQLVAAETSSGGKAQLAVFGLILLIVFARGKGIAKVFAVAGAPVPERPALRIPAVLRDDPFIRHHQRWLGAGALLVTLALPRLPGFGAEGDRFLLVLVVVYALIGVALTMLLGWGGQVSLGHFAVVGIAAFLTAKWSPEGWTLPALLLVTGAIGATTMVVIGLPALRVRGLTLAVTTLGLAVVAPQWLFLQGWLGGDTPFTTPVERPAVTSWWSAPESQLHLYYLAVLVLVIAVATASALRRSTAGRVILAVRDNERASAAFGLTPATVKLSILAVSGFFAGAAGVFWAIAWQRVSPVQFGPDVSMAILAIPVIGGLGSVPGALAGAALLYLPTFFLGDSLDAVFGSFGQNLGFLLLAGGVTVVFAMHRLPNGIAGAAQARWQRYLDERAARVEAEQAAPSASSPLVVEDLRLRFGGIVALDGAAIEVRDGEIVGLIGPNGAGKTTLMNVVSGVLVPSGGSVKVFGHEVIDLPADVRAGYGLARSFQDASLFAGLTVRETIEVALSGRNKTGVLPAMVAAPWVRSSDRSIRRRADEVLEAFGLVPWADTLTSGLSTGTRRICDLAAQVATEPKLLLLDEPTAGVAQREAEAFGPLVRRIRDDLGCAILIIEHDMPLLMGLCDRVYAMEAGRVIAEGTPREIREDDTVIASYLGTENAAIERSNGKVTPPAGSRPRRRPLAATAPRGRSSS